ncbi:DUF3052 family protein [Streptomyces sp. NRRL S-241]|uniref:DUF3052 family protein n=1 Tax=Streptomyces sp. NRRL S-241 TaxID=1463896 RepID=UPI0018FE9819
MSGIAHGAAARLNTSSPRRHSSRASHRSRSKASSKGPASSQRSLAERLGFEPGQVVPLIGRDEDCDTNLHASTEAVTGRELVGESHEGHRQDGRRSGRQQRLRRLQSGCCESISRSPNGFPRTDARYRPAVTEG